MRSGMYAKIAVDNLKKNHRLYIPYILSGSGLLACFYIIYNLSTDARLRHVRGGSFLPTFMGFGTIIMGILAAILIFYTNSFLMKQRKREYGLYNVLGMEKRHVGRIMLFEALISALIILVLGSGIGMLFYKLCTLIICRFLHVDSVLGLYFLNGGTILFSAGIFAFLYMVAYFFNRLSIRRIKPVDLLKSTNTGEKEPRVRWVLLVLGVLGVGSGYILALTVTNPLIAINRFFTAVLLVIFGTYFLFVAGSIFVLKLLKKNPKYYYTKKHMPAVSGLMYRMKQNAVGLASITILACGVLVMISSTICLYFGVQDTLKSQYNHQITFSASYNKESSDPDAHEEIIYLDRETLTGILEQAAEEIGAEVTYVAMQRFMTVSFAYTGDRFETDRSKGGTDDVITALFISQDYYSEMTGTDPGLCAGEIAVVSITTDAVIKGEVIRIGGEEYRVRTLDYFPISVNGTSIVPTYGIIVDSEETFERINELQKAAYGENASAMNARLSADLNKAALTAEEQDAFYNSISNAILEYARKKTEADEMGFGMALDTVWAAEENLYSMYGTLLFLGILLAIVFMFAAVLIIYYKQISEGYEDRARFQIMEKVGMSRREVRDTIRHQILLVFFLPLIVAGIHIAVAFRLILQMMKIMMLTNVGLFVGCTIVTYILFALVYTLIYRMTARTYYKIVY